MNNDMSYQNSYGNGVVSRNKAKERSVWQLSMNEEPIKMWTSIKEAATALGANPSSIMCVCKYAEEVILHG